MGKTRVSTSFHVSVSCTSLSIPGKHCQVQVDNKYVLCKQQMTREKVRDFSIQVCGVVLDAGTKIDYLW